MAPSRSKPCAEAEQHQAARDPPSPSDGSSGEEDDGSSFLLAKRGPEPAPQREASGDGSDDYEEEEYLGSDSDSDSSADEAPEAPLAARKGDAPSSETFSQMERTAPPPPTELPRGSTKRKARSPAKAPATPQAADKGKAPAAGEARLEERAAACRHLWGEVQALDAEWPGLRLKEAFLSMDDARARKLDKKIEMHRAAQLKLLSRRMDVDKDVTKALTALLD